MAFREPFVWIGEKNQNDVKVKIHDIGSKMIRI